MRSIKNRKKLKSLILALAVITFVASALVVTGCSSSKVQSKSNGNQLVMDSAIKQGKLDNGMSDSPIPRNGHHSPTALACTTYLCITLESYVVLR